MPRLSQCVPILDVNEFSIVSTPMSKVKKENKGLKEIYDTLDKIHSFAETGNSLFCGDFGVIGDVIRKQYEQNLNIIFKKYEKIPEKYGSLVLSGWSRHSKDKDCCNDNYSAVERRLSVYPMTSVKSIKSLAVKLNMIIVHIEFMDLVDIVKVIEKSSTEGDNYYYYSRNHFSQNEHYKAITRAKGYLNELKESRNIKSQMYILCPMSYYSFWNEICSSLSISKYYPIALESVFMTIDLMLPAQKNLYAMSKANEKNYKNLSNELQTNIEMISKTLKGMESRISTIEGQMTVMRQRQATQEIEIARLKEVEAQMQQMLYCLLDPLVFYVHNDAIDFRDEGQLNRKAHLVSCFGPEFPVEFLESNGIVVYNMKDVLTFN